MIRTIQRRHYEPADTNGRAIVGSRRTHVRRATTADLTAIVTCLDLAFVPFTGHRFEDRDDVQQAECLRSQLLDGSIGLICDETHVLGYISFWPTADQMFIDTLAVLPSHHRQGLGSKLLAFAESETLRLGFKAVTLFTKATMTGNSEFYQNCGYRETGRCDDDGFCRVFFTKAIAPLAGDAGSARTAF